MDSTVLFSNRKDCEMKPSHTTTPRTLADCTFTTGYPSIRQERRQRFIEAAAGIAVFAFIGVLLAWRG